MVSTLCCAFKEPKIDYRGRGRRVWSRRQEEEQPNTTLFHLCVFNSILSHPDQCAIAWAHRLNKHKSTQSRNHWLLMWFMILCCVCWLFGSVGRLVVVYLFTRAASFFGWKSKRMKWKRNRNNSRRAMERQRSSKTPLSRTNKKNMFWRDLRSCPICRSGKCCRRTMLRWAWHTEWQMLLRRPEQATKNVPKNILSSREAVKMTLLSSSTLSSIRNAFPCKSWFMRSVCIFYFYWQTFLFVSAEK